MLSKKPKIIKFLIIIIAITLWLGLGRLTEYSTSIDYTLLNYAGVGYLYFILGISIFCLDAATLWFLFKPKPIGLKIAILDLIFSSILNIIVYFIMINNIEFAKNIAVISRNSRGLSVNNEFFNILFTPIGLYISIALILGFTVLFGVLFWKEKKYFYGNI